MQKTGERATDQAAEEQVFQVELSRTISTTVTVRAASAEAALDIVDSRDFPLPSRDEWDGHKDWRYVVYDADGDEVGERDR